MLGAVLSGDVLRGAGLGGAGLGGTQATRSGWTASTLGLVEGGCQRKCCLVRLGPSLPLPRHCVCRKMHRQWPGWRLARLARLARRCDSLWGRCVRSLGLGKHCPGARTQTKRHFGRSGCPAVGAVWLFALSRCHAIYLVQKYPNRHQLGLRPTVLSRRGRPRFDGTRLHPKRVFIGGLVVPRIAVHVARWLAGSSGLLRVWLAWLRAWLRARLRALPPLS